MNKKCVALSILLLVAGCDAKAADTQTGTVASVSDLASLFEGEFTTLPDQGSPPAGATVLYNLAKRVQVSALGDEVVYAEQHEKAPDGPMLWQRLFAFRFDKDQKLIVMTPYNIGNGPALTGAYKDTTPLAKLDIGALKPQAGGCVVIWHRSENGFEGVLKPGSCKEAPNLFKATGKPAITVTKTDYTEQPPDGSATPIVFRRIH